MLRFARLSAERPALRALLPIGAGHVASIVLFAGAVSHGLAWDRERIGLATIALLVATVAVGATLRWRRRRDARPVLAPADRAALALASFGVSTLHGVGLMLMPALMPLCVGGLRTSSGAAAAEMMTAALAAVALHALAMLAVGIVTFVLLTSLSRSRERVGARVPPDSTPKSHACGMRATRP